MKKAKTKTRKNIVEILASAYIRRIKKWMFCPACQNGKMTINKNQRSGLARIVDIHSPQISLRMITYSGFVMGVIHISTIKMDLIDVHLATYAKNVDMRMILLLIM